MAAFWPMEDEPDLRPLELEQAWIDECYAGDDPVVVVHRLEGHSCAEARAAAETIRSRSPLAVAITLEALRRAGAKLPCKVRIIKKEDQF